MDELVKVELPCHRQVKWLAKTCRAVMICSRIHKRSSYAYAVLFLTFLSSRPSAWSVRDNYTRVNCSHLQCSGAEDAKNIFSLSTSKPLRFSNPYNVHFNDSLTASRLGAAALSRNISIQRHRGAPEGLGRSTGFYTGDSGIGPS